ncbi:MAG: enoyl-CoA hydratase [Microthrixaceae bacterium]
MSRTVKGGRVPEGFETNQFETVQVEVADRIAVLTLNRPQARNALNSRLTRELWLAVEEVVGSDEVDAIVLTGADPAFCAGLDLRELASGTAFRDEEPDPRPPGLPMRFFPVVDKPIIAAVNGPAITGGFEVALQCTFIIASERARFADTHARVGILPGAGLTALLTEAVGVRRATELSLTGNFLDAQTAYELGLVNRVVPHDELMATARATAADIVSNDQRAVRALVAHYRGLQDQATLSDRFALEASLHHDFGGLANPADRVNGVIERGRTQQRIATP